MGYLSNSNNEIIVDAILTKYGREKLASGQQLGITKFALYDDEVDYTLYNTAHPLGSDFFDIAIKNLPILEPVPNPSKPPRYYLYTTTDQVSFVYLLNTSVPSEFGVGLWNVGATYTFGASISPTPSNSNSVWFAVRFPKSVSSYFSVVGNTSGGGKTAGREGDSTIPQDLAKLIQQWGGKTYYETNDSLMAAGYSFSLTLKATPPTRTVFSATIDATGVAAASQNIQVIIDKSLAGIASGAGT